MLYLLLKDTLCVTLQNRLIRLIGVLHRNGLWEFSQHPLLEGFQPFVVVAATDELLVLAGTKDAHIIIGIFMRQRG